eukprot:TRINITY_DN1270_c0_g1_i3.p1 TRINITY_DN1270_c0_g1~~TRINITY_DN1270_c0_g1_i3.p1  ORF type:complete len:500 (+),score=137.80 TRINITY_DN1270_c0_g1_i3:558-2057(+)
MCGISFRDASTNKSVPSDSSCHEIARIIDWQIIPSTDDHKVNPEDQSDDLNHALVQKAEFEVEKKDFLQKKSELEAEQKQLIEEKKIFETLKLRVTQQFQVQRQELEVLVNELREENNRLKVEMKTLQDDCAQLELEKKQMELDNQRVKQTKSFVASSFVLKNIPNDELKEGKLHGQGTYKKVFKFKWKGRDVAVAAINGISSREEFSTQQFREVKIHVVSSGHPNIVALEGWTLDGRLVMEFCPTNLTKVQSTLSFERKIALSQEICRGLVFLHRLGVVHGDLKPDNILISVDGVAKLTDFGFAFDVHQSHSIRTETGGTCFYRAPEAFMTKKDRARIDLRLKDVYALGGVLLFMFCGEQPWKGETVQFVEKEQSNAINHLNDFLPVEQLEKLQNQQDFKEHKEVMGNIEKIIRQCYSTTPELRGSSRQVLTDLESIWEPKPGSEAAWKKKSQKLIEEARFESILQRIEDKVSRMEENQSRMEENQNALIEMTQLESA